MLINITLNVICKLHIKAGHFKILRCNLLLITNYLFDKFNYYYQPKEVRIEVFTTAIINVILLWDVTPCKLAVKYQL